MRAVAIVNASSRITASQRAAIERICRTIVTHSLDEARTAIRAEIKRGVDLVVLGGGDGTFVMSLALIGEACRGEGRPEPAIGMLALGSGNALARTLGASRQDPVGDLARLVRGDATWRPRPMLEVQGLRTPFAGVGQDASIIDDHERTKRLVDSIPIANRLLGPKSRYVLSVTTRSIPNLAFRGRTRVRVVADAPSDEITPRGEVAGSFGPGDQLWEGECTLVAAATIPYFGFGLKMFPFAELRPDRFHLRCGDPGFFEVMRSAPAAFLKAYFSRRTHDFTTTQITVISDEKPIPVEVGGELVEPSHRVEIRLAPPVSLAELRPR